MTDETDIEVTDSPAVAPYSPQLDNSVHAGTVAIESSRAIAEAQASLLLAKQFPRNRVKAVQDIKESCQRFKLAESAMYSYPRGGQIVTGPSIRMAEELARCYGNIDFGIKELSQKDGVSEMMAYAWDTESNVKSTQNFTVRHIREKRGGDQVLTSQRDIYELCANMGGRRLRARILAILPPDIVDMAVQECQKTLAGNSEEPMSDRIDKVVTAFKKFGVTLKHIEDRVGHSLEALSPDEFVELRSIYNTVKDGHSKAADFFGDSENRIQSPKAGDVTAKLKSAGKKKAEKKGREPGEDDDIGAEL